MPKEIKLEKDLQSKIPEPQEPFDVREYSLVSPLWGGGEQPNRRDSVTGIRPSSIKGQLRFWWRAVRGWQAQGKLERLLELEEQVWGGTSKVKQSSRVRLKVELVDPNDPDKIKYLPVQKAPRYAAFPLLQGSQEDKEKGLSQGIRFRLKIWLDPYQDKELDIKQEVEAALWAWETFGGIGARTRRGFGAVTKLDAQELVSKEGIQRMLENFGALVSENWPKGVPHLTKSSPIAVIDRPWEAVIKLYQSFRQYRPEVKTVHIPGKGDIVIPGPNKWPEPTLIRWAYKSKKKNKPQVLVAPRAQFGLPVPFFFLQEKHLGKGGKMALTGKQAAKVDRLASPLIIRPLDQSRTLVAVLEAPRTPPGGVHLNPIPEAEELKRETGIKVELDEKTARKLVDSGLKVLEVAGRLHTDPVLAFWHCVQDSQCVELLESVELGR